MFRKKKDYIMTIDDRGLTTLQATKLREDLEDECVKLGITGIIVNRRITFEKYP